MNSLLLGLALLAGADEATDLVVRAAVTRTCVDKVAPLDEWRGAVSEQLELQGVTDRRVARLMGRAYYDTVLTRAVLREIEEPFWCHSERLHLATGGRYGTQPDAAWKVRCAIVPYREARQRLPEMVAVLAVLLRAWDSWVASPPA